MIRKIFYSTVLFIILLLIVTCTLQGVEWGLIGTWESTDYKNDNSEIDDYESTLIIYSNDTYDLDVSYNWAGEEYKFQEYGKLKACNINKYIQFFSDKNNDGDRNGTYDLYGNVLTLYLHDGDIEIEYVKK